MQQRRARGERWNSMSEEEQAAKRSQREAATKDRADRYENATPEEREKARAARDERRNDRDNWRGNN